MYAPPRASARVQTVYMASESHGPAALVATVLYLADRGFVTLENPGADTWRIVGRAQDAQWGVLDPGAQAVGNSLGLRTPGRPSRPTGPSPRARPCARPGQDSAAAVSSWASSAGLVRTAPQRVPGAVRGVLAVLLAALGFSGLGWATMRGLPFAAFAIGGVTLLATGVGHRRTPAGRIVWSQAGGFERLLSTPSAEDRFDFAARKDLFIAYVPYAVAFGVADRWAEKYRVSTQSEPPIPGWYPSYVGSQYGELLLWLPVRLVQLRGVRVDLGVHRLAVVLLERGRRRVRRWRRRGRRRFVVTRSRSMRGGCRDGLADRPGRDPRGRGIMIVGFNKLRRLDIRAQEALGGIDVQLTRRADLIPNLVATVKGYAAHESGVLEEVTAARAAVTAAAKSGSVADQAAAEAALDTSLVNILAVAEAYATSRRQRTSSPCSRSSAETEDQLAFARQYYNDAIASLNTAVATFPWMLFCPHGRGAQAGLLRGPGRPPGPTAGGVLRPGRPVLQEPGDPVGPPTPRSVLAPSPLRGC